MEGFNRVIGYNIHGNNVPDKERLYHHLATIQPSICVVMDNVNLAINIKNITPKTEVVVRVFPSGKTDDNIHRDYSADEYFRWYESQNIPSTLSWYVNNEPHWDSDVIDWLFEFAQYCLNVNRKVVLGNFSVGVPEPHQIREARKLIKLASEHPDILRIGLHEYAQLHWTSYISEASRDNPPQNTYDHDFFLMGRYLFWHRYCEDNGLELPQIYITEWGFDKIHGIGGGQHAIEDTWDSWGRSDFQNYAYEQLLQAYRLLYRNVPVALFCWGRLPDWVNYDYSNMPQFQDLLEITTIPDDEDHNMKTVKLNSGVIAVNVRTHPDLSGRVIDVLNNKDRVTVFDEPVVSADGYIWQKIEKGDQPGWAAANFFVLVDEIEEDDTLTQILEQLRTIQASIKSLISLVETA